MKDKTIEIRIRTGSIVRYAIVFVCAAIIFSGLSFVFAVTPNPGHPWTDVGNGFWQASNSQTLLRTFTFPDADETVLTTAGAPQGGTVIYGSGTGVLSTTTAGTAGFVLALLNGVPTWAATTTLLTISGTLSNTQGGTGQNTSGSSGIAVIDSGTWSASSTLALYRGGTNAALTASNGGIVWSNASQLQILGGTATANKVLLSGATAAPTWSTPTFPGSASATSRKIIVSDGTNWVASTETHAVPGTAGNLMESDGTNWVSAAGGVLIGRQTLLTGTVTYTPTAGTNSIVIRMVGGGGGGGGATGNATPNSSWGGGGGSGSYAEKRFAGIAGAASYTVAIGAGGLAGVAANGTGGTGGITTFACPSTCTGGILTVTANGGLGGVSITTGTSVLSSMGGAGAGVSTNGDVNANGAPGEYAVRFSGNTGQAGSGVPSAFGGGAKGSNATGVGATSVGFGGGGAGAASISTAANAGGAGAPGVLVIWEFR